jgi:hypothetical protein
MEYSLGYLTVSRTDEGGMIRGEVSELEIALGGGLPRKTSQHIEGN